MYPAAGPGACSRCSPRARIAPACPARTDAQAVPLRQEPVSRLVSNAFRLRHTSLNPPSSCAPPDRTGPARRHRSRRPQTGERGQWTGTGGRLSPRSPQCPCHSTRHGEALDTGFPHVPRSRLPHTPLCWRCLPPKRIPPVPTIRSAAQRGHRRSS